MTRSPAPRNQSANTTRPPCTARTLLPAGAPISTPSHLARESPPRAEPKRATRRPSTGQGSWPRDLAKGPPKLPPALDTSGPLLALAGVPAGCSRSWRCCSARARLRASSAARASRSWRARVSSMVLRTLPSSACSCWRALSFLSRSLTSWFSLARASWRSLRAVASCSRRPSRAAFCSLSWFCWAVISCSTLASWRSVSLKVSSCSRRALLR
ncbi:hypothetical protein FQZ97_572010 [compost metagenome]